MNERYSLREVAAILGVTVEAVKKYIDRGVAGVKLSCIFENGRRYIMDYQLDEFIKDYTEQTIIGRYNHWSNDPYHM